MKALMRFVLWVALAAVAVAQPIRPWLNPGISDPRNLTGLAAWYDASDTSSLLSVSGTTITDGGSVALWSDKSGNSGVNCLVLPGVAGNSATFTALTAFGTGNFSVSAKVRLSNLTFAVLFGSANNGFLLSYTSAYLQTAKRSVANNTQSTNGILSALTEVVVGYTRSGTTGTYYINGVAINSITDSQDYTSGITTIGATDGGGSPSIGTVKWARVYNAALDATAMAADAAGTVQANNVLNCDFSTSGKKLANLDTFVCSTGQTVTLKSSGATGARIAGERDLFQGTAANRPVYLGFSGTKYGYLNGVSGTNFSTPDSVAVSLTLDADLIWDGSLDDWTPAATTALISKYDGANTGYELRVTTGGLLTVIIGNGSTAAVINSSTAVPATNGQRYAVRVAFVSDTGAGQYSATFYAGPTVATMSVLGLVQTGASIAPADVSQVLYVGARSNMASLLSGRCYYASISGTIGGASAAVFDPQTSYTSGTTFTASTGEVWTLKGGATIVTRSGLYFDGSNDYLKSAAFSGAQPISLYGTLKQVSWTSGDYLLDGFTTNSGAIIQTTSSPQLNINAGSSVAGNTGLVLQTGGVLSAILNGASSAFRVNLGTATTGNAGATAFNGVTVGARGAGDANYGNLTMSELVVRSAADATATQDSFILYDQIKWQIW